MGQVNSIGETQNASFLSRRRTQSSPLANTSTAHVRRDIISRQSDVSGTTERSRKRPHPSSVRRSIFGRASQTSSSVLDGNGSTTDAIQNRQGWLRSRRWAKLPFKRRSASPVLCREEPVIGQRSEASDRLAGSSLATNSSAPEESLPNASRHPIMSIGSSPSASHTRASTTNNAVSIPMVQSAEEARYGIEMSQPERSEPASDLQTPNEHDSAPGTGTFPPVLPSGISPSSVPTPFLTPTPQGHGQEREPTNQFPHSGTLVVVQGLVQGPETNRNTTRPGWTSSSSGEQQSSREDLQNSIPLSPSRLPASENLGVTTAASQSNSDQVPARNIADAVPSSNSRPNEQQGVDATDPGISSSVDLIGTLLSVATALTAASLLANTDARHTGVDSAHSTQPDMLNSNLLSGLAIPTLARLLAGDALNGRSTYGNSGLRDEAEGGTMRSIWDSLRGMIGHGRGRSSSSWPRAQDTLHPLRDAHARERGLRDPTEVNGLLRELTSAFTSDSSRAQTRDGPQRSSESDEPSEDVNLEQNLPDGPGGSFEQFLEDVQSNLRTALTQIREDSNTPPTDHPPGARNSDIHSRINREDTSEGDGVLGTAISSTGESRQESNETSELLEALQSAEQDAAATDSPDPGTRPTSNSNAQNLSWWRLFQFPATSAPRQAAATPSTNPSSTDSHQPSTTNASATITPFSSSPLEQNSEHQDGRSLLVPVVVVGLRYGRPEMGRAAPGVSTNPTTDIPSSEESDGDNGLDRPQHDEILNRAGSLRRRMWPPRAAPTMPVFRDGADATGQAQGGNNRTGPARSFFVYVFGGYVPPDHHILAENANLDSFEALWELADFFGQAKSSVATDEDIQRAGLQTFKASQIRTVGEGGKIASNCLDKCLICLDDYEPEDDLRLLSCKHAFHQNCVDRWLKEGRNNCPACRTTGVSVGA